ncbi:MAG TPA: class I adenylate-forming enzyme family protein [Mycobacterium sp.]|nr:class I adenylate-forming enzyme family protein [Mycobacterium sp.]
MINTELICPVGELLRRHATHRGGAPAFRDDERAEDWAGIERRTAAIAAGLRARVDRGACVAICLDNRVEGAESYLGVVRAGNVAAYLNPAASDGELAYMLNDCRAQALIADARYLERTWELTERVSAIRHVFLVGGDGRGAASYDELTVGGGGEAPDDLALDDPAFLLYTSGTTGRPKGVILTQRSCLWVVAACWTTALGLSAEDDLLSPLPLFHSYGLNLPVLAITATGASARLLSRFSTRRVIAHLREEDITVLAGVPTMFQYLMKQLGGEPMRGRALRASVSAGAIMPGQLAQAFEQVSDAPLLDGYGITETSTMVTMNWLTAQRPPGSCGLPVPGCAVRIVDPHTGQDVPYGVDGELIVRGPQLMRGYHQQPQATAEALRDGWYRTGDLAHSDLNGYLTITGRIKELIIRGGENIYPAEVECVIAEHEAIRDAAVIGVPDPALGEVVLACIVCAGDDFDENELRMFLGERLSDYKIPARFVCIDEIPRTKSGKVQRHRLRTLVGDQS